MDLVDHNAEPPRLDKIERIGIIALRHQCRTARHRFADRCRRQRIKRRIRNSVEQRMPGQIRVFSYSALPIAGEPV